MWLSPWAAMGLALLDMEVRWVYGLDKRGQACGLQYGLMFDQPKGEKSSSKRLEAVWPKGCKLSNRSCLFAQAVGRPFLYKNTAMGSKSHTFFP